MNAVGGDFDVIAGYFVSGMRWLPEAIVNEWGERVWEAGAVLSLMYPGRG